MIAAVVLAGYCVAVLAGTRLLRRPWAQRAPRVAIACWQLAATTVLIAAALGLLVLTVPVDAARGPVGWLDLCAAALRAAYRSPGDATVLFAVGFLGAAILVARTGGCLASELWRARRARRRHIAALTLVGTHDARRGITVVEHPAAAAYCVPGVHRRIVLTSAALAALDAEQLAAVLAHERAHLAGRHDLVLAFVRAVARAIPLPPLRAAATEVGTLVEMLADDAVGGREQRRDLAAAVVMLGGGGPPTPTVALSAAGAGATERVVRLLSPIHPLPRPLAAAILGLAVILTAAPVALAGAPAAAAVRAAFCPAPPH